MKSHGRRCHKDLPVFVPERRTLFIHNYGDVPGNLHLLVPCHRLFDGLVCYVLENVLVHERRLGAVPNSMLAASVQGAVRGEMGKSVMKS